MRSSVSYFFLLILLATGPVLKAQIFGPSATDSVTAIYGKDKVFVFNKPYYKAPLTAGVVAVPLDRTEGWTFRWSVYSKSLSGYRQLSESAPAGYSWLDTVTVTSGYLVEMIKGEVTDTFRTWIIINDLEVKITNKDEYDTLRVGYYDCHSLDLIADTNRPATWYYNPATGLRYDPGHNYVFRWTTDNKETSNPTSRLLTRVNNPPWKDTWYILTVTDRFGLKRTDSVIYKSVQSKAIIQSTFITLIDTAVYPPREEWFYDFYEYDAGYKSAPAIYKFDVSESKNFAKYQINFGDGDSVILSKDTLEVYHEYQEPGTYKVILTTWSDPPFACIDTAPPQQEVLVDAASADNFSMPNVFTPGSGENGVYTSGNLFRTTDVSVTYIDIAIFTRTGLKVHEYEGNIRDWEGWDGKIMNSGRDAPEGVYFYVISRFNSYQDKNDPIARKLMKGFIHLYRP